MPEPIRVTLAVTTKGEDRNTRSSPAPAVDRRSLDEEILLLESGTFRFLGLPPSLEAHFEVTSSQIRSRRLWIEGIFCVILYNCFLLCDYSVAPNIFSRFVIVRLGIGTPLAILVLILLRRGVSSVLREAMVVFICGIFAASIIYLYFDISAVASAYAVADLTILILFTNVGLRIRHPYALAAAAMCLAFGGIFIHMESMLRPPEKLEGLAILSAAAFLSIVGNYSLERGERLNFLWRLRSEAESGALTNENDYLVRLANEDRLTGLSNRRHFEDTYKALWGSSIVSGSTISVILVDIDNFKLLNDRYGHLYGDAVLRRVAVLLKQCLRGEDDFVARYGGEEFVIVLPDSTETDGARVAQRMRSLVEIAGSPAVGRKDTYEHGWATVSCGVASRLPRKNIEPSSLIALADKALYQAKNEGRNRVCISTEPEGGA